MCVRGANIDRTISLYQQSRGQEHTEGADARGKRTQLAHRKQLVRESYAKHVEAQIATCKLMDKLEHYRHNSEWSTSHAPENSCESRKHVSITSGMTIDVPDTIVDALSAL